MGKLQIDNSVSHDNFQCHLILISNWLGCNSEFFWLFFFSLGGRGLVGFFFFFFPCCFILLFKLRKLDIGNAHQA